MTACGGFKTAALQGRAFFTRATGTLIDYCLGQQIRFQIPLSSWVFA